jgi:uncharacterized delta-60 repeat protein
MIYGASPIVTNGLVTYLDSANQDKVTRNLLTYSSDLSNPVWGKTRSSVTASSMLSPFGTSTGVFEWNMNTGSNDLIRLTAPSPTTAITGGLYTFSTYVKQRNYSGSELTIGLYNSGQSIGAAPNVAVTNSFQPVGSFGFGPAGSGSAILRQTIDAGNGWYRLAITANFNTVSSYSTFLDFARVVTGSAAVGTGIYVFGPQLENGTLTQYQPTLAATRSWQSPIPTQNQALSDSSPYSYNTVNKTVFITSGSYLIPTASASYPEWTVMFAARCNWADGNNRALGRNLIQIIPQGGSGANGYMAITLGTFNNQGAILTSGSSIYIGGQFAGYNNSLNPYLVKLNSSGTIDTAFNLINTLGSSFTGTYNMVNLTSDSSGRIWATGTNFGFLGISIHDPNSGIYTSILPAAGGIGPSTSVGETIIDESTDSVWTVGHTATSYNNTSSLCMTKFKYSDYSRYSAFDTSTSFNNSNQFCAALDSNKDLYVGGSFSTYKGTSANNIVKVNGNTAAIDNTFNYGVGFNNQVNKIRIQADGKIIVGGVFTTYSGSTVNRIVRLNTNGTIDNTFNYGIGFGGNVVDIQLQSDGKIIAVGAFTTYSGSTANRIVRLNTNGTIDNTFNYGVGFNSNPTQFKIQDDGKIVLLCTNTIPITYSGSVFNDVIRINTNGTIDNTFTSSNGFDMSFYRDDFQARLSGSVFFGNLLDAVVSPGIGRLAFNNPARAGFFNNWHIYTISFDSTRTFRTYTDSIFKKSATATAACDLNPRTLFGTGQAVEYGSLAIYNRALTPQEITQNYNFLKSRYNL